MTRIVNNTGIALSPRSEEVISKNAASVGTVIVTKNPTDGGNDTLFNIYDEDQNYLFSIDTDADGDTIAWELP